MTRSGLRTVGAALLKQAGRLLAAHPHGPTLAGVGTPADVPTAPPAGDAAAQRVWLALTALRGEMELVRRGRAGGVDVLLSAMAHAEMKLAALDRDCQECPPR